MTPSTERNKELIEQTCDAINEQDKDTFMSLQDPEIVHHHGSEVRYGVEAVTDQVWSALDAFPDLTITPETILAEDDLVALRYTLTGTHNGEFNGLAPTGKEFQVSEMKIYRVDDGKVAEVWTATDQLGLLTQLDVVKAP
ncbi:ester cyclase [Haloarcula nitratireducens]|uniref:Ester cyclase n=1 Tax=Haloarcula nitratireducens TaxID=2487749 RepID=A0AAW4PKI8_9EURY|nr:ester cyclase [Halomicroarcula nitratireducens]MBX0298199.1 ester cyclase [Halomicroarcula nitratireducens]